jgi:hypothetical protein
MINVRSLGRVLLAGTVLAAAVSIGGATPAFAGLPWWHINTISSPPSKAGGEGQIVVEAANLGDSAANQNGSPVTVEDKLPPGIEAVHIAGQGLASSQGEGFRQGLEAKCSLEPRTVACAFPLPVMPYEHVMDVIDVKVAPGAGDGVNEVSVFGGFVRQLSSRRPLALEGPPPPFGVASYELVPEEEGGAPDTQAGSHPFQLTTTLMLNTQAEPKLNGLGAPFLETVPPALTRDLRFNLPPGLIGNPTALPKCPVKVFGINGQACPQDTIVGVATTMIVRACCVEYSPGVYSTPVYNLEPAVGEPARFGFGTGSPVGVFLDTSVRTGGDYGVTVTASNITQYSAFIGSQVTFWGAPSDHRHDGQRGFQCLVNDESYINIGVEASCPLSEQEQPFLIMPTGCTGPPVTSVEGDSWSAPGLRPLAEYTFQNNEGKPFGFDGCNQLNFEPSISIKPDVEQASTPTGLEVKVHVPQEASLNPNGRAEAAVKDTTVTLPEGVTLNPGGAEGLEACSEAEIGFHGREEEAGVMATNVFTPTLPNPFCPDGAKVGTVEIETPLLPHALKGAVYLASPAPSGEAGQNPFRSLIAMYIVAEDPISGTLVKLPGDIVLDPGSGRLTSTFRDTPQLPFENLILHFFGGSRAPLGTPALCGAYTTTASFAPWSGNPAAEVSSPPFPITTGPNGSPCSSPLPFSPSLHASSTNLQAGAFTPFTATMSRQDGQQDLQGIRLQMPPGLSGVLTGVTLCPEPQASQGTCRPDSLIGETTVSVGLGVSPFSVTGGRVYITGPYKGAPFGLSIVNPAKAGPFDLRKNTACDCVVVRAKIEVDPTTATLTVTTDDTGPFKIPTIIDGIPLKIQHVNVTIARPGFTFNPTNCARMSIAGSIASSEGASRALSVPFQVTNCATLTFKPRFKVSTSSHTSRANGASLDVKLSYPKAPWGSQANIAKVKVNLPKQLPSRLNTLQKACPDSTFNRNPATCPAASKVGTARATTPIIPVPLSGPAYFVSHGGAKFPELIVVLQGYGVTVDLHGETFIKAGITSSTFKTVPDVPVGTFELKLPQGHHSALAANGNLCKHALKMPTAFTAQNGLVIHQSTKIAVTGCSRRVKRALQGKRHGR